MLIIKITKINQLKNWLPTGVHFKLNGQDYFLHYSGAEYEDVLTLYKGRNKGHLIRLASCYGVIDDTIIHFIRKPGCLKYVDTERFINRLKELKLWKGEFELL